MNTKSGDPHCPISDDDLRLLHSIFEQWIDACVVFEVNSYRRKDGVVLIVVPNTQMAPPASPCVAYELHKIDGGLSMLGRANICWVVQIYECQSLDFAYPIKHGCVTEDSITAVLRAAQKDVRKVFRSQISLEDAIAGCTHSPTNRFAETFADFVEAGKKFQQERADAKENVEDRSYWKAIMDRHGKLVEGVAHKWKKLFGNSWNTAVPGEAGSDSNARTPRRGICAEKMSPEDAVMLLVAQAFRIGSTAVIRGVTDEVERILDQSSPPPDWPLLEGHWLCFRHLVEATMCERSATNPSIIPRQDAYEAHQSMFDTYMKVINHRDRHPEKFLRLSPGDFACDALDIDCRDPSSPKSRFLKLTLMELLSGHAVRELMAEEYSPPRRSNNFYKSSHPKPSPVNSRLDKGDTLWKGWHEKHQWVVLDREVPINSAKSNSRKYGFVRLADLKVFWDDREDWKSGKSFQYFKARLNSILADRSAEERNLEALVSRYMAKRSELQMEITESYERQVEDRRPPVFSITGL